MRKIKGLIKKRWYSIYAQSIFTVLVFIPMVLLSYLFASRMVHNYIIERADKIINLERIKIEAELMELSTALGIFSESVKDMLISGDDESRLRQLFFKQTDFLRSITESSFFTHRGFYGYFYTLDDIPVYINCMNRKLPDDFNPANQPWYQAAIAAGGKIGESYPYLDLESGEVVFSYARSIFNNDGQMLGVVCLDVLIRDIAQYIIDTSFIQGGFGILLSQDLILISFMAFIAES